MLHKLISTSLVIAIANLMMATAFANTASAKDLSISEIKQKIQRLGTGESAKVKVSLIDKTEVSGYVSRADEDSFTVVDKEGNSTSVRYSQVRKVKGNNLSTGAKIAIGVGIGVAVLVVAFFAKRNICTNALCQ